MYLFISVLCTASEIRDQRSEQIMAWYPTNSAQNEVDFTSSFDGLGRRCSHVSLLFSIHSAATWLLVLLLHYPALSVYIALWYTMRCITQTMRSKYEIRCLSASIIIDSSTFWLSSRCHLKYLQSCLHCTLFGSALLSALGISTTTSPVW